MSVRVIYLLFIYLLSAAVSKLYIQNIPNAEVDATNTFHAINVK